MLSIVGYADRLSVAPSESLGFCVSCEPDVERYRATIVRLVQGDPDPAGPGHREEPVATAVDGEYRGRWQEIRAGSCAIVPPHRAFDLGTFSIQAMIWPTRLAAGRQGIVTSWSAESGAGYGLVIDDDGAVALLLGDGAGGVAVVGTGAPLMERCWYFAAATFDGATGVATVHQHPVISSTNGPVSPLIPAERLAATASRTVDVRPAPSGAPLVIGGHYNGKIDSPRVTARALDGEALVEDPAADGVVAAWDFAHEITPDGVRPLDRITDRSPNALHGATVNMPARAMTGLQLDRREHDFAAGARAVRRDPLPRRRPRRRGLGGRLPLEVPADLQSGVYAARLTSRRRRGLRPVLRAAAARPRDRADRASSLRRDATWPTRTST